MCLLFAVAACSPGRPAPPTPSPTAIAEEPTVPPPATATATTAPPSPTATATPSPVPSATPTSTAPPTATGTPTPEPSATPTAEPTSPPATPTPPPGFPALSLQQVAAGLDLPTYATHANDGSGRLFVLEKPGKIRVIRAGELELDSFLDIDPLVGSNGLEQGLLGLAFHPDFAANGRLFVDYTNNDGDTVVAEYRTTPDRSRVDPATARVLLTVAQPYGNHNGGQLQFGPDGYLYVGLGDGGAANDPEGNGQNPGALLGKILRISVDGEEPYAIPEDNPFAGDPAFLPEIWALGLRNPWRFSFDRLTGDLYIADVGQNAYEEIDIEPAGSPGGLNFGWSVMEGAHCFQSDTCDRTGLTLPVAEYGREDGCSVTGGYVYRGSRYPALDGIYFYGDYCSGKIWGLRQGGAPVEMIDTDLSISSFGEDEAGEVYVVDLQGAIYQLQVP